MIRPGSQSAFQIISNVFNWVEIRALCRPVRFLHADLDKPFLYGPCFMHGVIVMLKQERVFPKLLPKLCGGYYKITICWSPSQAKICYFSELRGNNRFTLHNVGSLNSEAMSDENIFFYSFLSLGGTLSMQGHRCKLVCNTG